MLPLGKPFKVAHKHVTSAFGGKLEDYATVECYGCAVPTAVAALVCTLYQPAPSLPVIESSSSLCVRIRVFL